MCCTQGKKKQGKSFILTGLVLLQPILLNITLICYYFSYYSNYYSSSNSNSSYYQGQNIFLNTEKYQCISQKIFSLSPTSVPPALHHPCTFSLTNNSTPSTGGPLIHQVSKSNPVNLI